MSQEYTEDKHVKLKKISGGRRLLEAVLIVIALCAAFLMVALISFNPSDPSWSQTTWHEPVKNLAGSMGAWFADILFSAFGILAYIIPPLMILGCWTAFRQNENKSYVDFFSLSLRIIGGLALVLASCALASLNIDDLQNFAAGGVVGSLFSTAMLPWFNAVGATLALLCLWSIGFMLLTGWSWLTIAEKIGAIVLGSVAFITNSRRDSDDQDDYYDENYEENHVENTDYRDENDEQGYAQQHNSNEILSATAAEDDYSSSVEIDSDDILFSAPSAVELARQVHEKQEPQLQSQPEMVSQSEMRTPQSLTEQSQLSQSQEQTAAEIVSQSPANAIDSIGTQATNHHAEKPESIAIAREHYHFEVPDAYRMNFDPSREIKETVVEQTIAEQTTATTTQASRNYSSLHQPESSSEQASQPLHSRAAQDIISQAFAAGVSTVSEPMITTAAVTSAVTSAAITDSFPDSVAGSSHTLPDANFAPATVLDGAQVKQGIGPELPRPNPVRIPTRRELYGIRIPSLRDAELERLRQDQSEYEQSHITHLPELDEDENELQQAQLREAFLAQQRERYGDDTQTDKSELAITQQPSVTQVAPEPADFSEKYTDTQGYLVPQDKHSFINTKSDTTDSHVQDEYDQTEMARLQAEFLAQQQNRYEQTTDEILSDLETFNDLSPIKDLVDDMPVTPLFTPMVSEKSVSQPINAMVRQSESISTITDNADDHNAHRVTQQSQPTEHRIVESPQRPSAFLSTEQANSVNNTATPKFSSQPVQQNQPIAQVQTPQTQAQATLKEQMQDSLFHPFLVRNDQSLPKPTTPMPSLDLLSSPPKNLEPIDEFTLEQTARLIEARLNDYRIKAKVVGYEPGPVITRYELDLAPGVKAARISNLARDLARSLSAVAVRIVEVIPGKPYVGLELPNLKRQTVFLREVLDCDEFRDQESPLSVVLGKDISGQPVVADLAEMPHLLVAGTTGSGKSVGVNAMIISILYKAKPEDVRFIMIDPKMLELSVYEGIPHLLTPVVTDMKDAANALRWCVAEMERRYKLMSALGVRHISGYNQKVKQAEEMGRPIPDPHWKPTDSMDITPPVLTKEPYIVVMVDEFADLMMTAGKKVEEQIARLAQKARAAGIHLVLATQRPSVDVITGLIKANIPTRIAFTVSSKIDSRTILDQSGAESLLGMGDMLFAPQGISAPIRVHGAFVRDEEVHAVANDWKARGRPEYIDNITSGSDDGEGGNIEGAEDLDPLFDQAVEFVTEKGRVSISGVQRQFRIGYNRAARIVEQMEVQNIVSEPAHNGIREVLAPSPREF